MEFGKHIGKGMWAFADKALPAIYGLGFIFLVIRVLPEKEYGAFVLIQTVFTIATAMTYAFAVQPMTKFVAESNEPGPIIGASLVLQGLFLAVASVLLLVLKENLSSLLDPKHQVNLSPLFTTIPLLFLSAFYRNFAIGLLQARYQMQKIFWIDAVYFVGVLIMFYVYQRLDWFHSAQDVININIMMFVVSSVLALILTRRSLGVNLKPNREAFLKMWSFGKYTFGGSTLALIFSQMDVFFVSSYAGLVAAATYNAAKILNRLFDMLSQVVQMFLVPFSSKAHAQHDVENLTVVAEKTICFSTILLFPVFFVMLIMPEQLLHLLYKGKYDDGASIVRVLSLFALMVPWNAVIASYMVGTGKVKEALSLGILYVVLSVPLFALLTSQLGSLGASIGYTVTFFILTLFLLNYVQRIIPLRISNVVKRTEDVWVFIRQRVLSLSKNSQS